MTGAQNVIVEAAAFTKEEITEIAYQLDDLGLRIEREHLVKDRLIQPYSGFRVQENF